MNLNCVNARARTLAESHLEAASKEVEQSFRKLQLKDTKSSTIERSIDEIKQRVASEQAAHLEWLQTRKTRLETELAAIQSELAEKKMLLQERTQLTSA
jgi:hypothetical protein